MENTLVILKPDGVNKKLLFEIIKRFEENGLYVSNLKTMMLDKEILNEHYHHLVDKPFYKSMEDFMLSSVVVVMIVSGESAIAKVRDLVGATDSKKALAGTIRHDYGNHEIIAENVIHASDSIESSLVEIKRFYQIEMNEIDHKERVFVKKRG